MVDNVQKLKLEVLKRRDRLSDQQQRQHSQDIRERVLQMDLVQQAKTVFIYIDFRSEVQTRSLIQTLMEMGKKVVVPVTLVKEKDLLPVAICDLENDLAPGYASIPEPVEAIRQSNYVAPETIDLILLPGSVFDERGGRMGYGGGFYDRFVSNKAHQAHRIGLCYEVQVVEKAPLQQHDELLDGIVTEKRILQTSRFDNR